MNCVGNYTNFEKIILVNMIVNLVENVDKISKKMENFNSAIKNIKVNQTEMLRIKIQNEKEWIQLF